MQVQKVKFPQKNKKTLKLECHMFISNKNSQRNSSRCAGVHVAAGGAVLERTSVNFPIIF